MAQVEDTSPKEPASHAIEIGAHVQRWWVRSRSRLSSCFRVPTFWKKLSSKRLFTLSCCAGLAATTLFINLFGVIYLHYKFPVLTYSGAGKTLYTADIPTDRKLSNLYATSDNTIFRGSCNTSKKVNLALHIVINLLSTILLAASNMGMQLMVAPTRSQVDDIHPRHLWLDVGIPSYRNLKYVGWYQRIVWLSFALSSLPIHFLYVYLSIQGW